MQHSSAPSSSSGSTAASTSMALRPTSGQWKPASFDYETSAPMRPPGSRKLGTSKAEAQQQKLAESAAIAAAESVQQANQASLSSQQSVWFPDQPEIVPGESDFSIRFDHICIAVSDVSNMVDFLSQAGGRACEGFLTPVYLSTTWEFSNTAELQVIAPVESFHHKRAGLSQEERPTTTKAFWNGNNTPAGGVSANKTAASASPSNDVPRPRSTFLQRYLRKHGPSVHHVAFLVPNLEQARRRFQSFGYTVHGFSNKDPLWKEFFLTPKQSLGVVIQIAESGTMQPNLSWTNSSAMLSQTHLTPVVKKHIAQINQGVERWEADPSPPLDPAAAAAASQKPSSKSTQKNSQVKPNKTAAPESPAGVISPSHSSALSPQPPRLSLLGLRLRCSSEYKARRQWGDMLQAASCTELVNEKGMKTLCFRWAQAPMYIAVDIESPTAEWTEKNTAQPSSAAKETRRGSKEEKDLPQWDAPKWIEMHAPESEGGAPIPFEAANDEMNLELSTSRNGSAASSSPSPTTAAAVPATPAPSSAQKPAAKAATPVRAPVLSADQRIKPRLPVKAEPQRFSPRFRRLPLDEAIMRSAFVETSAPIPLPQTSSADSSSEKIKLVTVSTKEIKSKL